MTALSYEPDLAKGVTKNKNESLRKMMDRCRYAGAYRTSQAGHIISSMSSKVSNDNWAQQIKQQCASTQVCKLLLLSYSCRAFTCRFSFCPSTDVYLQMKERIYQRISGSKADSRTSIDQSHFLSSSAFCDVDYRVPSNEHLWSYDNGRSCFLFTVVE